MKEQRKEEERPESRRLYLTDKWYISIDEEGRCVGPCAEGALGFVLQLESDIETHRMALKLPRLMGETFQENAYIIELMEQEMKAVHDINASVGDTTEPLLRAETFLYKGPLRTRLSIQRGTDEARSFDGAIVMVRFEKGENPRFCAVKRGEAGLQFLPEKTRFFEDQDVLEQIEQNASDGGEPWSTAVFLEAPHHGGRAAVGQFEAFSLESAFRRSTQGTTWFASLPTLLYPWAPGTLQEAIGLNARGEEWGVREHFALIQRVAEALKALHANGMLHGDIRPANIAYRGSSFDPKNYFLNDYGSFSKAGARPEDRNPQGGTRFGPVVSSERSSAFYSLERRAGREREAADTAVIHTPRNTNKCLIVLGWRSKLLHPKTSEIDFDLESTWKQLDQDDDSAAEGISKGDRVQVRDYIFEVSRAKELGDKQILECERRSWRIYQGRIVIENTDPFPETYSFPISRTVELLQWSAATDLYSLGALFLYSMFRDGRLEVAHKENPEEEFRQMLSYLENPPYFNSIWFDLESMRRALEDNLEKSEKLAPDKFAEIDFTDLRGQTEGITERELEDSEKTNRSLLLKAIDVVRRITTTVPGARRLVEAFEYKSDPEGEPEYDLGPFILFIHFVLCCVHRQAHFDMQGKDKRDREVLRRSMDQVFCETRREPLEEKGAADRAARRLEQIAGLLNDPKLHALRCSPKRIPRFDPRSDTTIRELFMQVYAELERNTEQTAAIRHNIEGRRLGCDVRRIPVFGWRAIFENGEPGEGVSDGDFLPKNDERTLEKELQSLGDLHERAKKVLNQTRAPAEAGDAPEETPAAGTNHEKDRKARKAKRAGGGPAGKV